MVCELYLNKSRFSIKELEEVNVPICLPIVNPNSKCIVASSLFKCNVPNNSVDN